MNLLSNTLLLSKLGLLYPLTPIFKTGQIVWKTLNSIRVLDLAPQWNTGLKTTQNSSADAALQSNQWQEHRAGTEKASDLTIGGNKQLLYYQCLKRGHPCCQNKCFYFIFFDSEKIPTWNKNADLNALFFLLCQNLYHSYQWHILKALCQGKQRKKICSDSYQVIPISLAQD